MLREVMGDLLEDGCLADAALTVDDQDMVNVLARQRALDPIEHILAAKEHAGFGDRRASDVRVEQLWHSTPGRNRMTAMMCSDDQGSSCIQLS